MRWLLESITRRSSEVETEQELCGVYKLWRGAATPLRQEGTGEFAFLS